MRPACDELGDADYPAFIACPADSRTDRFDRGQASIGDLVEFLANKVVAQHLLMADADYFPLFLDNKD